jgi:hypothetical protein
MTISTRFVIPIVVLALAGGAIVWPSWLRPHRADPCAHPDVLGVTALIPGSQPEGERRDQRSDDVIQWSEGRIPDERFPRDPLLFRIVRNYSVLKAAERPLAFIPKVGEPETTRIERVDAPGGPLPVHVVRTSGREAFHVVAFLYAFGNEPVAQPFVAQLTGAFRELWHGRRPLTVFIVGGDATPETARHREEVALRWITAAWQHYRSMCVVRPGSGAADPPSVAGAP